MSVNSPKLLSGRVPVTPYSNLTSDRYQFLGLSQAEPSLGAGYANSVLTLGSSNARIWSNALNISSIIVSSANVTGTLTVSNINVGNITGTGDLVFGNVYANSGTVRGALLTGTITTNSQPNITQVGTLSSLDITGDITSSGNIYANSGTVRGALITGTLTTNLQPNINQLGILSNLTVGNSTANTVFGNGTITAFGTIQSNSTVYANSVSSISSSGITITAAGTNSNISLVTNGTGNVILTPNTYITGVAYTPINPGDAASKNYVDTVAQGLSVKDSVLLATTTALPAYTYNNGTSGVGATITANTTGALSLDSTLVTANSRVLVKNETSTNAPYNGIYLVTNTGNSTANFVLTRTLDFDSSNSNISGSFTFVETGSLNQGTGWVCTTPPPVTFGISNIVFTQFSTSGTYTAGTGLTLTGTQFSITDTAVTAGSYGNGDRVVTFTVNQQGQLTAASNAVITANAANLTGTTLASSIVNSSLTSVGLLSNLTVGNSTANTIFGNGTITATGNIQSSNLTVTQKTDLGAVGNVTITGGTSGQVLQTDGSGNLSWLTEWQLANNGYSLQLDNGGNLALNSNAGTTGALYFNGSDNIVLSPGIILGSGAFTIELWFQVKPGYTDSYGILGPDASGIGSLGARPGSGGHKITWDSGSGSTDFNYAQGSISPAAWHYLVFVRDSSNNCQVFLDGIACTGGSQTITDNLTGYSNEIGGWNDGQWTDESLTGYIGGIKVVVGSNLYSPSASTISVPSSFTFTDTTGTALLINPTNSSTAFIDATGNSTITGSATFAEVVPTVFNFSTLGILFPDGSLQPTAYTLEDQHQIFNSTSNVNIPDPDGNVNISVNGTPNIVVVSTNGIDVSGTSNTTNLNVSGISNLGPVGNVTITGGSSGQYLQTNGSGVLTWSTVSITSSSISNGNSNVNIPAANGNVNISSHGNANILVVTGTGANITGTANITGNLSSGNVAGGNLVSANYLQGTLTIAAQPNITSVGLLANLTVGNATANTVFGNGTITAFGNITGGNLTTGGLVSATSNVTGGNLTTGGLITATGNITSTANVTGGNLTTGGLVSATGNVTGGNLTTSGLVSATGNIIGGNLTTNGLVSATGNVTGGNLTTSGSLSVTGNANVGNIGATTAVITTGNITTINSGLMQNGNSNITITANGNINFTATSTDMLTVANTGIFVPGQVTVTSNTGNTVTRGAVLITTDGTYVNPQNPGVMLQITGQTVNPARVYIDGVGTNNYAAIIGRHYNGTTASPSALNTNDIVSRYAATPYTSGGWPALSTTRIDMIADENQTSTNQGSRTEFWITPTGSNVIQKQAVINTAGFTVNANLYSNNANLGNLATANYVTAVANITAANANITSNLAAGNIKASGVDVTTGNVAAGNISSLGLLSVTGNIISGNANLGNLASANYIVGNGVGITGLTLANSLTDVAISSPTLNQVIGYNGAYWVNQTPQTTTSAGSGVTFWFTGPTVIPSDANNYVQVDTLSSTPNTTAVSYLSGNIASGTTAVFGALQSGVLGRTALDAGTWTYGIWANANAVNGGTVTITGITYSTTPFTTGTVTLTGTGTSRTATASADSPFATAVGSSDPNVASYLQTPNALMQITAVANSTSVTVTTLSTYVNETAVSGNVWNELFLVGSANLTTTLTEYNFNTTQGPYVISNTASLGILITATSTRSQSTNVSITLNGTTTASSVKTPLITLHDNLAGLQGGQTGEYFHLTQAEYTGTGTGDFVRQTSPTLVTPNIGAATGTSLAASSNVTAGNVYANSGTIGASLLTGTLTTVAQPNITSVGTLSSLSVTGNISSGNANLGNLINANYITSVFTTAASSQPNITTIGTLTSLNVSGLSNLGPVGNVTITGGSSGQYLQTDGTGVLTWVTIPTSSNIANGNSNVSIPLGNGNVNIWTNGTKKWVFDTSGNLTTPSGILLDATSNISNANIVTANYLVSTGGCVTVGTSTVFASAGLGGLFNVGGISNVNIGLGANVTLGSSIGNVNINNVLNTNGDIVANANITVTNTVTAANVAVGDLYSSRAPVVVGTGNVIVDQFPLATYRSAKYTIKAGSDNGYQALEVLLVHDSINSIITIYGSLSTSSSDLVILNSTIAGGNVQLYALGLYANTTVNLMGTYVPD